MYVFDLITGISFGQFIDDLIGYLIGEEQMILLEPWLFEFGDDIFYILSCGSDQIKCFEVGEFFCWLLDFLYEVNVVFIKFGLCVYDGDHGGGFPVEQKGFHAGDLSEDVVEIVLGDVQDV